ncbi:MAG: hypothetical protein ACYTHN_19975, partial [Planctomycetota bacterium]
VVDSSGSGTWPDYWNTGFGGGVEFAYQIAPGFRIGGGGGYHFFSGTEEDLGFATLDYGTMSCIPIRVEGTICFPFGIPSHQWFRPGAGFVPGPVLYAGVELAGVYRPAVEGEVTSGSGSSTTDIFESCFAFFFGVRVGFEYRLKSIGLFGDVGYRIYTAPKEPDGMSDSILEMHTFPIRFGIAIYFGSGPSGRGY